MIQSVEVNMSEIEMPIRKWVSHRLDADVERSLNSLRRANDCRVLGRDARRSFGG